MIHVFNGCTLAIGSTCDLCSSAISGFFGLFGKACDGCAYFCHSCCKECDIASIFARPCCCYVMFASIFMIPSMILAVLELADGNSGIDIILTLVFAALHWLFALYLQGKMGKGLEELEEELADKPHQQAMGKNDHKKSEHEEVLLKMWTVILYDFVFLFYILFTFPTFIYGVISLRSAGPAFWMIFVFQLLSVLYLIWWYLITSCCAACACCAGFLTPARKKKAPQQQQNPDIQMQGVPQQQPPMQSQPMGQPMVQPDQNQAFAGASAPLPPPPPPV